MPPVKYPINIHAHSIFSDGISTPYVMALKAKELGFSALVITDHFYGLGERGFTLNKASMRFLRRACKEANKILPIIIGMEIPLCGQEVLLFGGAAIKSVLEHGVPAPQDIPIFKQQTGCAMVLCHPGEDYSEVSQYVDGYEHYNGGNNFFKKAMRKPTKRILYKQRWCNSDAHRADSLGVGYNLLDRKIKNESDLIKYIKSGRQHEYMVRGKSVDSL